MNTTQWNVVDWRRGFFAAVGVCLLPMAQFAYAQGSDDQYEITMKMEMPGMAMPPISQRMCVKKGASDEDLVPRQENCLV